MGVRPIDNCGGVVDGTPGSTHTQGQDSPLPPLPGEGFLALNGWLSGYFLKTSGTPPEGERDATHRLAGSRLLFKVGETPSPYVVPDRNTHHLGPVALEIFFLTPIWRAQERPPPGGTPNRVLAQIPAGPPPQGLKRTLAGSWSTAFSLPQRSPRFFDYMKD